MTQRAFNVVLWVRKGDAFDTIRDEILTLADREPDESTEYQGTVDFHWAFVSQGAAQALVDALKTVCHRPEVVVLRVQSFDAAFPSLTLKDTRHVLQ